ncbi:MAG: hypothetical protein WDN09_02940 [bacterium]
MKKCYVPTLAFALACGFLACKPAQESSSLLLANEPKTDTVRLTGDLIDHYKITEEMLRNERVYLLLEDSIVIMKEFAERGSSVSRRRQDNPQGQHPDGNDRLSEGIQGSLLLHR